MAGGGDWERKRSSQQGTEGSNISEKQKLWSQYGWVLRIPQQLREARAFRVWAGSFPRPCSVRVHVRVRVCLSPMYACICACLSVCIDTCEGQRLASGVSSHLYFTLHFVFKDSFILCVWAFSLCLMSVDHMHAVPMKARKRSQIHWDCSYRWL